MKYWLLVAPIAVCLGCEDKPKVEVKAPGVNIKAGAGGAEVKVPGVDVKAGPGGAEVKVPGVDVKAKKD